MSTLLINDDEMVERMEVDLATKAAAAFVATGLSAKVYGVFSLDDLEEKMQNELQSKIGIGVGYHKASPLAISSNAAASASPGRSGAVKMIQYEFLVILATPTDRKCMERYTATKLLTILRRSIHGSTVAEDAGQRVWNFMLEKPEPEPSTDTMMYHSQLWQVSLPLVGTSLSN